MEWIHSFRVKRRAADPTDQGSVDVASRDARMTENGWEMRRG